MPSLLSFGPPPPPRADGKAFLPKKPPSFNLKADFGARGNGRTDDTQALARAIAAASARPKGGVIFLPAGTYVITKPLTIKHSGVVLRGDSVSPCPAWPGAGGRWPRAPDAWPQASSLAMLLGSSPMQGSQQLGTSWASSLKPHPRPSALPLQRLTTKLYFPRSLSEVTGVSWVRNGNGEGCQEATGGARLPPRLPSLPCSTGCALAGVYEPVCWLLTWTSATALPHAATKEPAHLLSATPCLVSPVQAASSLPGRMAAPS